MICSQVFVKKKHSTVTATMKEYYAELFLDLSKAFDMVEQSVLSQRLVDIGMSLKAVKWFANYFRGLLQSVQVDDVS